MSNTIASQTKEDPLANYCPTNLIDVQPFIKNAWRTNKWVPMLHSSPGVGKSSVMAQLAEEMNLLLIDLRLSTMDPVELNGFPFIFDAIVQKLQQSDVQQSTQPVRKVASYIPMDLFPLEGHPLPIRKDGKPYAGWLLFLDEFSGALPAIQIAAYKLILDHYVGMHKLHSRCWISAAGNLITDKAIVHKASTATQSRLQHFFIKCCSDTFHWWADQIDPITKVANVDIRIRTFLKWKDEMLHDFDPDHTDCTFACPRTWKMLSDNIQWHPKWDEKFMPLLASCIGTGAARMFHSYTAVYTDLPTKQQILDNPTGIHIPDEPDVHWALSGLVGTNMTPQNCQKFIQFVDRLDPDFQLMTLRQAIANDDTLMHEKSIMDWRKANVEELIRGR